MSRISHALPVEVNVGECKCGTDDEGNPRHADGDVVYLRPRLSLDGGLAAVAELTQGGTQSDIQRRVSMAFVRHGVVGWNFTDDDGKEIPVTPENIEAALPWSEGGFVVANKAAELYADTVTGPLAKTRSGSPQRGPTALSTSPRRKKARSTSSRS